MLLAYENEAIFAQQKRPGRSQFIDPAADDPDREPGRGRSKTASTRRPAKAFVNFLRTPAAQRIFGENGYRPVVKSVAQSSKQFPARPGLFTIDQLARRLGQGARSSFFDPQNGHLGARSSGKAEARLASVAPTVGTHRAAASGRRRAVGSASVIGVATAYLSR